MRLVLSRRADADIADISRYSIDRWGVDQARHYVAGLMACLDDAVGRAHPGRTTPDLPPSIRRLTYRSHVAFVEPQADRLFVLRVLHQRMDHVRHLS